MACAIVAAGLWVGPALAGAPDPGAPNAATRAYRKAQEGTILRHQGQLIDACEAFRDAVALTPSWGVAHFELGRCLRLLGDPHGRAADELAEGARRGGAVHPGVLALERGRLAEDRGDKATAWDAYRAAVTSNPADMRAVVAAARTAPAGEGALARLRALVRRQPTNLAAWARVAALAEAAGRLDEAEAALRLVLERSAFPARAAAALGQFGLRQRRPAAVSAARAVLAR